MYLVSFKDDECGQDVNKRVSIFLRLAEREREKEELYVIPNLFILFSTSRRVSEEKATRALLTKCFLTSSSSPPPPPLLPKTCNKVFLLLLFVVTNITRVKIYWFVLWGESISIQFLEILLILPVLCSSGHFLPYVCVHTWIAGKRLTGELTLTRKRMRCYLIQGKMAKMNFWANRTWRRDGNTTKAMSCCFFILSMSHFSRALGNSVCARFRPRKVAYFWWMIQIYTEFMYRCCYFGCRLHLK